MNIERSEHKKVKITINPDTNRLHIRTIDWLEDRFLLAACIELLDWLQEFWYNFCIRWTENNSRVKFFNNKKQMVAELDLLDWSHLIYLEQ